MLSAAEDGYGRVIYDHFRGLPSAEIIERDDGWFGVSTGAPAYFAEFDDWPAHQRQAIRQTRGRTLDVGCGAGRVALHLQHRGERVVAIDWSPLAIKTCRLRGVEDARVLPITRVGHQLGTFETIVMFGNNFGLFGSVRRARWLLKRLAGITSANAQIVAESNDPYRTGHPDHKRYQILNRRRGRLPGQLRIRVRCAQACTPWFDYLLVSPREMRSIVSQTGWQVRRLFPSKGSVYAALLEKRAV
jgi:SAM-dependent methyltransferase